MAIDSDHLHRTVKLELDEGRAKSLTEAKAIAASYVLQVQVGTGIERDPAAQAALLTTLNTAQRAFLGGVRVLVEEETVLSSPWAHGKRVSEAAVAFGCEVVAELSEEFPTLVIGEPSSPSRGSITVYPTSRGWSGGVLERPAARFAAGNRFALSGLLAGALAVSEAFQHVRGNQEAGRRTIGLSLWAPELDWQDAEALGPSPRALPSKVWLLGLGHLGQAYAWALGFLPYARPEEVMVYLQDYDVVVEANKSTGLLVGDAELGKTKARVVARRLEDLGFQTRITERAFDTHTKRTAEEPRLALAGFDDPAPRRELEEANFARIVDGGLGAGVHHYQEIALHSFPSGLRSREAFAATSRNSALPEQPAYRAMVTERIAAGETEGEAECGVLEVAGRTVGASFVGAVAASLVLAEVLRMLARGPLYQVIDLSLRSPQHREVVRNEAPGTYVNPGYVLAANLPAT
jgi:molybdopterin/thiamine biosynthesis adenylyltransferase